MGDFVTRTVLDEYTGTDPIMKIPEGVTEVAQDAFENAEITEIVFPRSLEKIGHFAFNNCKKLERVVFPDHPIEMGNSAFSGCDGIKTLTFPLLRNVSHQLFQRTTDMFSQCANLTCVTFPEGTTDIPYQICKHCQNLTKIVIPKTMKPFYLNNAIGGNVTEVLIHPENPYMQMNGPFLVSRDNKTLYGCLKSVKGVVEIPEGVETIEKYAFVGAYNITEIVFPQSLKAIAPMITCGDTLCSDEYSICAVTLPDGVLKIGRNAFSTCSKLTSVMLPDNVLVGENAFAKECKIDRISGEAGRLEPYAYMEFGRYPQTAEGTDSTPISWIVVDVDDTRQMLLSKKCLDVFPFTDSGSNEWQGSTLQRFLNDEFLNRAFTAEERGRLLSIEEIGDMVGVPTKAEVEMFEQWISREMGKAEDTAFARRKAEVMFRNGAKIGGKFTEWWTRTKSEFHLGDRSYLWCVTEDGASDMRGMRGDPTVALGVRPVIWIKK